MDWQNRRSGVTCGDQMDRIFFAGQLREGRGNRPTGLPGNRSGCPNFCPFPGALGKGVLFGKLQARLTDF